METELLQPTEQGIARGGALLRDGKLVALPTETVYGLAADALNPTAVARIFEAKGRPMDNPLIVHIGDMADWAPLVKAIPPKAQRLADAFWPGPLTIILPASDIVPKETTGGLSTVAVRFPSHPVAQALILASGKPLAAPSANRSGIPSPTNARRVMEDMQGRIEAVMDGGNCSVGVESTVITLCTDPPRLLRPGGITLEMLREVLGEVEVDPAVTHALQKGAVASSPGMKYKHYSPKADVILVKGTSSAFIDYVNARDGDGVGALCFDEQKPYLRVPAVAYGHETDALEQARKVFDALRQADEIGLKTVYTACPKPAGVGLAVYNRLIRAAAFQIVNTLKVVGLTGPTGAGKTVVADTWREMGVPVIDADALAREVVNPGGECLKAIEKAFSSEVINADGTLNRHALATVAFASPERTRQLNAIVHPAVIALTKQRLEDCADRGFGVAVMDVPLLFESHMETMCHRVVAVLAPAESRLARIRARDGITETQARQRMNVQPGEDFYRRDGVTVLYNDGTLDDLRRQATAYWEEQIPWEK